MFQLQYREKERKQKEKKPILNARKKLSFKKKYNQCMMQQENDLDKIAATKQLFIHF